MPPARRAIPWAALVLLLAVLAYALHELLPPAPRWTIDLPSQSHTFYVDDRTLGAFLPDGGDTGRLVLWSSGDGQEAGRFFGGAGETLAYSASGVTLPFHEWDESDGQTAVVIVGGPAPGRQRIGRVGLTRRAETWVDVELGAFFAYCFAADCKWVALHHGQGRFSLVETATGRVTSRFQVPQEDRRSQGYSWQPADGWFSAGCFVIPYKDQQRLRIRVTRLDTGEATVIADAQAAVLGGSGDLLLVRDTNPPETMTVWELSSGQRLASIPAAPAQSVSFSDDGQFVAVSPLDQRGALPAEVFDVRTGERLVASPRGLQSIAWFLPDSRHVVLCWRAVDGNHVRLVSLGDQRTVWHRSWPPGSHFRAELLPGGQRLLVNYDTLRNTDLIEVRTGDARAARSVQAPWMMSPRWRQGMLHIAELPLGGTPWGKVRGWLGLPERPDADLVLHAVDVDTLRPLCTVPGEHFTMRRWMMDEQRTFVVERARAPLNRETGERRRVGYVVEGYDVPARKLWRWVLGPPTALGAIVLAGRWAWRRRRSRKGVAA